MMGDVVSESSSAPGPIASVFLDHGDVVLRALRDAAVAAAWHDESALPGMTVGALAAHLVEASVLITRRSLARSEPEPGSPLLTAVDYYVMAGEMFTSEDHRQFGQRAEESAAAGSSAAVATFVGDLARLHEDLAALPADRLVAVMGGSAMAVEEYLLTRLVEQVVHLDDLARSVDGHWPTDPRAEALVVQCGAEIGRRKHGGPAMIGALYRGLAGPLPVL
jgi:hypothetical protein